MAIFREEEDYEMFLLMCEKDYGVSAKFGRTDREFALSDHL